MESLSLIKNLQNLQNAPKILPMKIYFFGFLHLQIPKQKLKDELYASWQLLEAKTVESSFFIHLVYR